MSLESELIELISAEALIPVDRLRKDATLAELGLDSIDMVSVLFQLEDRYNVTLEADQIDKATTTLGQVLERIETDLKAKAGQ